MFLFCLLLGIAGLILMALPGLNHHSVIGGHHGYHLGSHSGGHGAMWAETLRHLCPCQGRQFPSSGKVDLSCQRVAAGASTSFPERPRRVASRR